LHVDAQRAGAQLEKDGGAVAEDPDLSVVGGQDRLGDGLIQDLLFGRHDGALESHGYSLRRSCGVRSLGEKV
jgi:hypothetical protein